MKNAFISFTPAANVSAIATALVAIEDAQIRNIDDYVLWVRSWKETHNTLVEAIKYLKGKKNSLCAAGKYYEGCKAWEEATILGTYATILYDLRDEQKENYHTGEYGAIKPVEHFRSA